MNPEFTIRKKFNPLANRLSSFVQSSGDGAFIYVTANDMHYIGTYVHSKCMLCFWQIYITCYVLPLFPLPAEKFPLHFSIFRIF